MQTYLKQRTELAVQYNLLIMINWNVSGGNIGFLSHKEDNHKHNPKASISLNGTK